MTRKDFRLLARALWTAKPIYVKDAANLEAVWQQHAACVYAIADALAATNLEFNFERFIAASIKGKDIGE